MQLAETNSLKAKAVASAFAPAEVGEKVMPVALVS